MVLMICVAVCWWIRATIQACFLSLRNWDAVYLIPGVTIRRRPRRPIQPPWMWRSIRLEYRAPDIWMFSPPYSAFEYKVFRFVAKKLLVRILWHFRTLETGATVWLCAKLEIWHLSSPPKWTGASKTCVHDEPPQCPQPCRVCSAYGGVGAMV